MISSSISPMQRDWTKLAVFLSITSSLLTGTRIL